ncbi:hypothetical protein BH11VER1_BH11VER1_19960 [soil metagenome]
MGVFLFYGCEIGLNPPLETLPLKCIGASKVGFGAKSGLIEKEYRCFVLASATQQLVVVSLQSVSAFTLKTKLAREGVCNYR